MFQFGGFPTLCYLIHIVFCDSSSQVFPHSEICGSKLICSSPQLIAACHVFRRLLMPRHSPCALVCLNFFCRVFSTRSVSVLSFKNCWVHLKQFWFVLLFSPFPQLLVRLKLYFFTLNFNLNLERPIWFQILSFSLLTFTLTCLFFRVLIKLI